jgi:hypothetical protein
MLQVYARTLLMNDKASTFVLPSALNDIAGSYTLRITDVVTGAASEKKIVFK